MDYAISKLQEDKFCCDTEIGLEIFFYKKSAREPLDMVFYEKRIKMLMHDHSLQYPQLCCIYNIRSNNHNDFFQIAQPLIKLV